MENNERKATPDDFITFIRNESTFLTFPTDLDPHLKKELIVGCDHLIRDTEIYYVYIAKVKQNSKFGIVIKKIAICKQCFDSIYHGNETLFVDENGNPILEKGI